jgi:hypothetical protein
MSWNNNNNNDKQRTGEWNMCYVEPKNRTSDPDSTSNIIYGVIPKSLPQSVTRFNLHPNTYTSIQMQKSVILGTCSIVRNFLNYK